MGERHFCTQQNGGEIYSGELRCGGPCDPIGVDLSATRDKGYGTGVRGVGKISAGNLFDLSFT